MRLQKERKREKMMRKKIKIEDFEYIEDRESGDYKIYYRLDEDYNGFYREGNLYKYIEKENKMIYIGSSEFSGDNSVTSYTEEYKNEVGQRLLEQRKKKYQYDRRRFRAINKGLEDLEFFKKRLNEIKSLYECDARSIKLWWL